MKVEVIASPALLQASHLEGRTVVVLDVLRATTTMTVALANGAREIRVFDTVESAAAAAGQFHGPKLLHGERHALPPEGFDLGNSPRDFTSERVAGRTLFMTTTNGTVAILAAGAAPVVLIGAIINAIAVAERAVAIGHDLTLLCAGQRRDVAMEDLIGCGAILDRLRSRVDLDLVNDACLMAAQLYSLHRYRLGEVFRTCRGARTELLQGLSVDIDDCAVEDRVNCVGHYDSVSTSIKRVG